MRIVDAHKDLIESVFPHQRFNVFVILGAFIGRIAIIPKIHSDQANSLFLQYGMSENPSRRTHIATGVHAGEPVEFVKFARQTFLGIIVVIHRIPPIGLHAGLHDALHHRRSGA